MYSICRCECFDREFHLGNKTLAAIIVPCILFAGVSVSTGSSHLGSKTLAAIVVPCILFAGVSVSTGSSHLGSKTLAAIVVPCILFTGVSVSTGSSILEIRRWRPSLYHVFYLQV